VFIGKGTQSNTAMAIKVYLMAILDNYMFRLLLAIFMLSSRELKVNLIHTVVFDYIPFSKFHTHNRDDTLPRNLRRDHCTPCALNVYSRTLS